MDNDCKESGANEESVDEKRRISISSDGDYDTTSIEMRIKEIEAEIGREIDEITLAVESKYEEFRPKALVSCALLGKLQKANKSAEWKIEEIETFIASLQMPAEEKHEEELLLRLAVLDDCKSKLADLQKIEEMITQLWYSGADPSNVLASAKLIVSIEEHVNSIRQDEPVADEFFDERICCALREELLVLRSGLLVGLSQFWSEFIRFPDPKPGEYVSFVISSLDETFVSERLSAMEILGCLEGKIVKFVATLMRNFCSPIVDSECPSEMYSVHDVESGREYRVLTDTSRTRENNTEANGDEIFTTLKSFFESLHKDLSKFKVVNSSFVRVIGGKLSSELIEKLIRDCLTPAIPYDTEDVPAFEQLLSRAEIFFSDMKEMGWFCETAASLESFAESYAIEFMNRRCYRILVQARSLTAEPFFELVEVGSKGNEGEKEAVERFKKAMGSEYKELIDESQSNKLFQLQKCKVSESVFNLAELLVSTLKSAVESDNEMVTERLVQTAVNILIIYTFTAPRFHEAQLSTLSHVSAVFYNNCYYLSHRLILALLVQFFDKSKPKWKQFRASFAPYIADIHREATIHLESMLTRCRRQISTMLADDQIFNLLDDASKLESCERTLNACCAFLDETANTFREVMGETVFALSFGNLVSFVLDTMSTIIIETEDIRACDAEITARLLTETIKKIEKIFTHPEVTMVLIHRCSETAYFRLKEVIFCLNGSLQEIFDRWCDGKGPLQQWLNAGEVRKLVKALFQNTAKRSLLLSKLH